MSDTPPPPRRAEKDIHNGAIRPAAEIVYTTIGLIITAGAGILVLAEVVVNIATSNGAWDWILEQVAFGVILSGLVYGNLIYQLTRIGYMRRLQRHARIPDPDPFFAYGPGGPRLTILVPSYKEETRVLRQALVSSALQRYSGKRVVLLIDDPPDPKRLEELQALEAARALTSEIQERLNACADTIAEAARTMRRRTSLGADLAEERAALARLHARLGDWFTGQAAEHPAGDHSDALFSRITYQGPAAFHRARSESLLKSETITLAEIEREYVHLEGHFRVEVTYFERKSFANLSHEPNKAMNLNSYIGLIGGAHMIVDHPGGRSIERAAPGAAQLVIPDTEYLITLDADSMLFPDYASRLIRIMEEPGNERLAVVQTPYSAVPEAPGVLERIAGATTDIQYNVHQGFAHHNGTYWVGANALLRMSALRDICTTSRLGDHEIKRYVSDRTVIEDTESSVDLLAKGWRLYNFPERLSFSATPPDFGALLVQRRRWSNGGLIILPKLLRHLCLRRNPLAKAGEGFVRIHYLVSPTLVNVGVPLLLIYPFEYNLRFPWLWLTAIPYFFFYARDLLQVGYRALDVLRVYALNLLLIPVCLSGILRSIRQMITGKTIAFQRTPKVSSRTTAPLRYVVVIYLWTGYTVARTVYDVYAHLWVHALFSAANGAFLLYAIVRFLPMAAPAAGVPVRQAAGGEPLTTPRPQPVAEGRVRAALGTHDG